MMALLPMLTTSINAQLGIIPNPKIKYPSALFTPYCASHPSNGWNAPSYKYPSSYFFPVCSAIMSAAFVSVKFR